MNILLIIADDLGWSDVGFHNGEIHTPNLDGLAEEHVQFDQFYTQPVCTATRVSIYTGDYPFRHGFDGVIWPWSDFGLSKKENLPGTFAKNGYDTYLVGKWHVGHSRKKYLPNALGFDYHFGGHTGCMDHWNHTYYGVHDFHENGRPIYPSGHSTDLYADRAAEILKSRSREKPFFMCLALNAPHCPLQTHDEFISRYRFGDQNRNVFAGMVTHMDKRIGDVLQVLKDLNQYDDTVIWFTSDNGGWTGDFGGTNFPLRDGKISFYEGGMRVVNVAKMPVSDRRIKRVCHASDIFPTLCDLADIECPTVDGFSVFRPVENRELAHHYRKFSGDRFSGCIRSGDWKYMRYGKEELYNIAKDPTESENLAIQEAETLNLLRGRLESFGSIYKESNLAWFPPHGPPPGFRMPTSWGPSRSITGIKILQSQGERENLSMSQSLGLHSTPGSYVDFLKGQEAFVGS